MRKRNQLGKQNSHKHVITQTGWQPNVPVAWFRHFKWRRILRPGNFEDPVLLSRRMYVNEWQKILSAALVSLLNVLMCASASTLVAKSIVFSACLLHVLFFYCRLLFHQSIVSIGNRLLTFGISNYQRYSVVWVNFKQVI